MEGKDGRGVKHIYLGGGHESFDCAVMEVSAYMVSLQSAKTSVCPPASPQSTCLMSVKEMKSDGGRG